MSELLNQLSKMMSGQGMQNGFDAVGGGLLAALFFGRKHPIKLFISGLVAWFMGYWFGGIACDIVLGQCSVDAYRGFSAGVGVISWPAMLLVPEMPRLIKRWVDK